MEDLKEKKEKVGFLEEKPNHRSSMRLFSLIVLMVFVVVNILYFSDLEVKKVEYSFISYDFLLLIGVFAPKYLQKLVELQQK